MAINKIKFIPILKIITTGAIIFKIGINLGFAPKTQPTNLLTVA
jgi:hypothetical protein